MKYRDKDRFWRSPSPEKKKYRYKPMLKTKPSVYLVEKCETFSNVLGYFLAAKGSYKKPINEKLLVFLAQIDWWDWEIENLIFSFDNFVERSKLWKTMGDLPEKVFKDFGVMVNPKVGDKIIYDRAYRVEPEIVAPWEDLNVVIDKWNRLVAYCEERLLADEKVRKSAVDLGAGVRDLSKYKKSLRSLQPDDSQVE